MEDKISTTTLAKQLFVISEGSVIVLYLSVIIGEILRLDLLKKLIHSFLSMQYHQCIFEKGKREYRRWSQFSENYFALDATTIGVL